MSCDQCQCFDCEREREIKAYRDELEKEFKHWEWNLTPAEVAREIYDKGWDLELTLEEMESFGFPNDNVEEVRDAYEGLY
jgi:hypothetical protein